MKRQTGTIVKQFFYKENHCEKSVVQCIAVVQNRRSGMDSLFIFAVSIFFIKEERLSSDECSRCLNSGEFNDCNAVFTMIFFGYSPNL